MEYAEKYTTMTLRFKPDEWARFQECYKKECDEYEFEVSKHRYLKMLIKRALNKDNGRIPL